MIFIDLKDAYLHISIVKHHHNFLTFVLCNQPYHWKVFPFGLAMAPGLLSTFTKPILFLCHCKGLHVIIYLIYPGPYSLQVCWQEGLNFLVLSLVYLGLHLALVIAQCCSDLTQLCIGDQHPFLQHNAAIFNPDSGGKMD